MYSVLIFTVSFCFAALVNSEVMLENGISASHEGKIFELKSDQLILIAVSHNNSFVFKHLIS